MNALEQAINTANELVTAAKALRDEYAARIDALNEKEKGLEVKAGLLAIVAKHQSDYAPLEAMEASLNARSAALATERDALEKAQSAFELESAGIRQELAAKTVQAQELVDQAEQVRADKAKLEQDKLTYRETIKQEMMASLK